MVLTAKALSKSLHIRRLKMRSKRRIRGGRMSAYLARLKKRRSDKRRTRKEPFTKRRNNPSN